MIGRFFQVLMQVLPCWSTRKEGSLYSIQGRLLVQDGNSPLHNARVDARTSNACVHTNSKGQFSLHLTEAPAHLVFSHEGFATQEIAISPPRDSVLVITMVNFWIPDDHKYP